MPDVHGPGHGQSVDQRARPAAHHLPSAASLPCEPASGTAPLPQLHVLAVINLAVQGRNPHEFVL